jgi:hypothetical protein
MPITKGATQPGARGNLVAHLDVRLPTGGLTDTQLAAMADALRVATFDLAKRTPEQYAA